MTTTTTTTTVPVVTATTANNNDNTVITIKTVPSITTTNINDNAQIIAQRPATNENSIITPSLDPRLLVNTVLTKQLFTNIIKEYSSSDPVNETTKFIIKNSL